MSVELINTEALRQLIREELRAIRGEEPQSTETKVGDEELTVKDVARMKGVRERTVYDWIKEKRIPYHRTPGGRIRVYRRHAERVLSESPRP